MRVITTSFCAVNNSDSDAVIENITTVKNLNALRVESGEPEPQNPWQAIIDKDPENAPELLRAAALGRNR